jgi:hypothetical protein
MVSALDLTLKCTYLMSQQELPACSPLDSGMITLWVASRLFGGLSCTDISVIDLDEERERVSERLFHSRYVDRTNAEK